MLSIFTRNPVFTNQSIDLNRRRYEKTGVFRAPQGIPKAGIDYIPPLNTGILNTSSIFEPRTRAARVSLPESFSWNNPSDVKKYYPNLNPNFISPVLNQQHCGSCWAFATSSCVADRWAIANNQVSPVLSPTYLLSCDNNSAKCEGGQIYQALNFINTNGLPQLSCQDYSWCNKNPICLNSTDGLDSIIPACQSKCFDKSQFKLYKTDKWTDTINKLGQNKLDNTSKTFAQGNPQDIIDDIKEEIFLRGPVATGFVVYKDFTEWPSGSSWYQGKTGTIYASPSGSEGNVDGGHAVVIVGWGMDTYSDGSPLPYWIIRNSWDTIWGDKGYFKAAMHNEKLQINILQGFDIPIVQQDGTLFGGAFAPLCLPSGDPSPPSPSPSDKDDKDDKDGKKSNLYKWIIGGVIAVFIILLLMMVL